MHTALRFCSTAGPVEVVQKATTSAAPSFQEETLRTIPRLHSSLKSLNNAEPGHCPLSLGGWAFRRAYNFSVETLHLGSGKPLTRIPTPQAPETRDPFGFRCAFEFYASSIYGPVPGFRESWMLVGLRLKAEGFGLGV